MDYDNHMYIVYLVIWHVNYMHMIFEKWNYEIVYFTDHYESGNIC